MHKEAPAWVRLGLTSLDTRRTAAWFRNASAALGVVMIGAGLFARELGLMSTAFVAVTAWVHTSIMWMDAHDAWS